MLLRTIRREKDVAITCQEVIALALALELRAELLGADLGELGLCGRLFRTRLWDLLVAVGVLFHLDFLY